MKTILLIAGAVAFSGAVVAQQQNEQTIAYEQPVNTTVTTATDPPMQGGTMKKDGKMWYISSIPDSITLDNKMVIYSNGTYKAYNGKTYTLQNGGRIDYEGAVEGMDQRINENAGMVVMDNGKMWGWCVLQHPVPLPNGAYVMPDGTLRLTTGKYIPIDDKTFIDFNGNASTQKW